MPYHPEETLLINVHGGEAVEEALKKRLECNRNQSIWGMCALCVLLVAIILVVSFTSVSAFATNDTTFEYVMLSLEKFPDGLCNDGSPPAFYITRNSSSTTWVIHLEGDDSCYDDVTCAQRAVDFGEEFLSTKNDDEDLDSAGLGILSALEAENPYFFDVNRALLRYCSSDFWVGNMTAEAGESSYNFLGSKILDNLLTELSSKYGLADATDIVFSGDASAGSIGSMLNSDRITAELAPTLFPDAKITGISDSGWLLDTEAYTNTSDDTNIILDKSIAAWNPILPDYCDQFIESSQGWLCFYTDMWVDSLLTPTFHFQNVYDWGMLVPLGVETYTAESEDYVENFAQDVRDMITGAGVANYLPSCSSHGVLRIESWTNLSISAMSPAEEFWTFFQDNSYGGTGVDDCLTFDCNPTCPPSSPPLPDASR